MKTIITLNAEEADTFLAALHTAHVLMYRKQRDMERIQRSCVGKAYDEMDAKIIELVDEIEAIEELSSRLEIAKV